jgi:putative nucleotidyltransferase with HDIG domain
MNPGSSRKIFSLYYALIVAGGFLFLLWTTPTLPFGVWPVLLLWLVLTIITDYNPVNLPNGGYITVASTLDYAGILIFGPVATAWVEVLNTFILHGVIQKKPLKRTVFNAAVFALTILIAGGLYQKMGGPAGRLPRLPGDLLPLLAMGGTYFLVNTLSVSAVIALSENRNIWRIWRFNFLWTTFHMLASVLVGLAVAVMHQSLGLWGVFLFITPLLFASYAFKLYTDAREDLIKFVRVLTGVIDEVDPYTHKHSESVANYSARIARAMQLPKRDVETIKLAGLLHDIGKIKMEHRELLLKPTRLTPAEKEALREHAVFGAKMAGQVPSLKEASEIVMYHHERMDGTGYPDRLPGDKIPIGARIIMAADAFDAMTTDRVYRKALPRQVAIEELRKNSGTQFDPAVIDCLVGLVHRGELDEEPAAVPVERPVTAGGTDPDPAPATLSPAT